MIDLCTRMVVGWQMADHMRTRLIVDALDMARLHGHLRPGAVFHSDRGTQYTSAEFAAYCEQHSYPVVSDAPACAGTMRSPNHSSRR